MPKKAEILKEKLFSPHPMRSELLKINKESFMEYKKVEQIANSLRQIEKVNMMADLYSQNVKIERNLF
jgi:hypothetical protein